MAQSILTVKFISKAGTYSALIQSPSGDLIQEYKDVVNGKATGVTPDFAAKKPLLFFQCTSSRTAENSLNGAVELSKTDMTYRVNGQKLSFGADDICNGVINDAGTLDSTSAFKGLFKRVDPDQNPAYLYPGLQILGNVADAFGLASGTVLMIADIKYGTQKDTIQADYQITVRKAAGESMRVTIEAGDSNCFAIREKGGSCLLAARIYSQGALLADTSQCRYKWSRLESGVWVACNLPDTCDVIEVSDSMIDTFGMFKVEVTGLSTGKLVDTQSVSDLSDPYVLDPAPNPTDMTIYEDGTNSQVTFTPCLFTKSGTPVSNAYFYFTAMSASGNILNPADAQQAYPGGHAFTVTAEQCLQSGGDITVVIEGTTARYLTAVNPANGFVNVALDAVKAGVAIIV